MRSAASTATKAILKQTEANQQQANSKPEQTPEATPNKRVETEEHLRNVAHNQNNQLNQKLRNRYSWKLSLLKLQRFPQACRLRILARFLFSVDCVRLEKSLPTQDTFGHPQPEPAGPHFLEVQAETLGSIGSRKLLESRATWKLRAGETGMRSTGYSDTSAVPQRFILFYRSLFPDSMVQTKTLATAADPPLAELTTTTTAIVLC
ncbi:unnamed protein product [[Candida] boidinii]|uniref:Unnamed protein product n=1 Tax=Candida boidinii TaxID=5477 RepID=A0A9W6T010_CANBO|nr:unnamed protein product [[Candida] boidinii]GMF99805.1 unnamed protein product [[Candida] boidinii]